MELSWVAHSEKILNTSSIQKKKNITKNIKKKRQQKSSFRNTRSSPSPSPPVLPIARAQLKRINKKEPKIKSLNTEQKVEYMKQ